MSDPHQRVIDQMFGAGIVGLQATDLIADGALHRFKPDDSKSKTAWYVLHEFTTSKGQLLLFGKFGDWRFTTPEGIKVEPGGVPISDQERAEFRKVRDQRQRAARAKKQADARRAALRAKRFWQRLSKVGSSPYLEHKQVKAYGVRFSPKHAVVVPIVDMGNELHGLQVIHAQPVKNQQGDDIEKQFFPFGMDPRGHFHLIGALPASGRVVVIICEGYATGATLHEACGWPVAVAFNAGNLAPVTKAFRDAYPDAELYIAADDDYLTTKPVNNPGVTFAKRAASKQKTRVLIPRFKNRTDQKWTDYNDLQHVEGLDAVRQQIDRALDTSQRDDPNVPEWFINADWQARLKKNQKGDLKSDVNNAKIVLQFDRHWKEVLAYCNFSYAVIKKKPPPFEDNAETGEWTDEDTARLRCWLAEHYNFSPRTNDTDDAVLVAAQARRFHPIKDYLSGLVWDGEPRLEDWLADFLGCKKTPYTMAVGKKWMIGAVARVMQPGCKMDHVLILEGGQGKGKSTALRILGGDYFSDTHFDLGTKDAYQQMRGIWIYEMAELDAFNKAESTRAKAFFSALEDNYRPSYGRRTIRVPRQVIIAGSTNQEHYLKDVTGNRRYWPVACSVITLDALQKVRDQLWAEALHEYKQHTPWQVLPDEWHLFAEAQEDRYQDDAWENEIITWLQDVEQRNRNQFTTAMIMKGALGMTPDKMRPPEQMRVGLIMKRLGWKKSRRRENGGVPTWFYMRPEEERHDPDDDPPI